MGYVPRCDEPSLSSLRIRAEKEQELADTDRYWKQKISELDKEQSVLTNLQSASMSQSLKEMSDQVGKVEMRPLCPSVKERYTPHDLWGECEITSLEVVFLV